MKCKSECKKLELVIGKNKPKLRRLAKGLDESKQNGQVWVALDEWCMDMRELLVRADEVVHECQSGSRPFKLVFSARLTTKLQEIRMQIEDKLNHTTVLETILEGSAIAQQHCHCKTANAPQDDQFSDDYGQFSDDDSVDTLYHGDCMVANPQQYGASMPHLEPMQHSPPGWDQHSGPWWNAQCTCFGIGESWNRRRPWMPGHRRRSIMTYLKDTYIERVFLVRFLLFEDKLQQPCLLHPGDMWMYTRSQAFAW